MLDGKRRYPVKFEEMKMAIEEIDYLFWNIFFPASIGRGKKNDMISPVQYERVFCWLYQLSKKFFSILKQQRVKYYKHVVI